MAKEIIIHGICSEDNMAQDYTTYLAEQVLNEQQLINYRGLSRALKIHNNLAKQMLFEFHRKQNEKKPGSVHATYLVSGKKNISPGTSSQDEDGDDMMQSSPPLPAPSSSAMPIDEEAETVPIRSIMLVREEHLDQARATFENISSIHVYSLEAKGLSQMQTLVECNRKTNATYASEDPLTEWKKYGTIQNSQVKRRTTKGPPPAHVASAPAVKPATKPAVKEETPVTTSKPAEKVAAEKPKATTTTTSASNTAKPPASKSSGSALFKSFAKTTAPKPKAAPPPEEDVPMGGFSDDDEYGDDASLPEELAEVKVPGGKTKKEREAELQAMMDQEDEPEDEDMNEDGGAEPEAAEAAEPTEPEVQEKEKDTEPTSVVVNGRRRGRRRIMKKRTVRDEEGYLVTKEEAAWESFSEDEEPATKKAKPTAASKPAAAPAKKAGGKPGQGNIMSFFSKK